MKFRVWHASILIVAITAYCTIGCSGSARSAAPTAPSVEGAADYGDSGGTFSPASAVAGTWVGSETAAKGESGTLSITFKENPSNAPGANVNASVVWIGATHHITYTGNLEGTLANMTVNTHNATPSYTCVYKGHGALNEAGNTISGTYEAEGAAPCPTKHGTFTVTRQAQ